jgi:predicted TIM-barrel fold metal-dependent hydrolase
VLSSGRRERVVLGYDDGLFSTVLSNRYVAEMIARAANDWTVAEWLASDERLYGLVMVSTATPLAAAEEIRRVGTNERMVGVALGGNGLSRPFGHPAYHPIYEAASELGLPLVLQAGPSDAFSDAPMSPVAGGYASTVAEFRALMWETHAAHMASMIVEGVFSRFPRLKLVLVGGGATWITGHLLRLDYWYRMHPGEARWLDRLPSEYFPDHVRVVTHGIETAPRPELLVQALETVPGIERVLLYGSGYPDADWQEPDAVASWLPQDWHDGVFSTNARDTFRWPDTTTTHPADSPT